MLSIGAYLLNQFVLPLAIGYVIGSAVVSIKQIIKTKSLTNNNLKDLQEFREILNSSPFLKNQTILDYQHLFEQNELQSLKDLQTAQVNYELERLGFSELSLGHILLRINSFPPSQRVVMIESIIACKKVICEQREYLLTEVLGLKI
jgi:hypothetical protein